MTNSQVYSLPPNKKITLTVNAVNINKPAVSAGFINLMYIWQYQSKWLQLGKYASNDNWVDLVDYHGEKTCGNYEENQPISLEYDSVFGYKVNFRLVIYSKNSLIANSTSKNVLNRYEKAIVSNLIKTICNDDKKVEIDLVASLLVINRAIKLNEPTTVDFVAKIENATIYENNQIDNESSSVKVIFEEYTASNQAWITIKTLPLLFKNHELTPLRCAISFNKSEVYKVRAKIILEKSWGIAPIFSKIITVNANFNDKEINFDQVQTILNFEALHGFNHKVKVNNFNWNYLIKNLSNVPFQNKNLLQAIETYELVDQNSLNPHNIQWTFINIIPSCLNSILQRWHSLFLSQSSLSPRLLNQTLSVYYLTEFNTLFTGLLVRSDDGSILINDLLTKVESQNKNDGFLKTLESSKDNHSLLKLMILGKLEINRLNINKPVDNSFLFNLAMMQNNQSSNLFSNFDDLNPNLISLVIFLLKKLNYLLNQKWASWKNALTNSLLSFYINENEDLNLSNQSPLPCFWIKVSDDLNSFINLLPIQINKINNLKVYYLFSQQIKNELSQLNSNFSNDTDWNYFNLFANANLSNYYQINFNDKKIDLEILDFAKKLN